MTPQARAPGAAGDGARAQLSPQSAASPGADCQSAGSHIAASLKLIAIVNPRDPRDANASTVALLEGESRPSPSRTPDDERQENNASAERANQRWPWRSINKPSGRKQNKKTRGQITNNQITSNGGVRAGPRSKKNKRRLDFEGTRLSGII